MPDIAKVLKEEISRLARKEVRIALDKTRKSAIQHQRDVVKLKNQVRVLERQVVSLGQQSAKVGAPSPGEAQTRQRRFVPKGLVSMRKRLGLSAADLGSLLGVTGQTIYNWEGGSTKPSAELQAKLASLRSVGKRKLQAHMAAPQD